MSTYFPSGKELAGRRKWYVVDASGQTVGHLASEVASILTASVIPVDSVSRYRRSRRCDQRTESGSKGNKVEQKLYRHHTLYPGGLRQTTAKEMIAKAPGASH
jgi:large subunit ribosomal protein L13